MASIHTWRSMAVAAEHGALAGCECSAPLWDLSKRELVEIVMQFAQRIGDDFSAESAVKVALEERDILKMNGLL